MTDTYQAIYDAVRSRVSGGDIGPVVRDVLRDAFDVSYQKALLQEQIGIVGNEMSRPFVVLRALMNQLPDGKWEARYGDCATYGATPDEASREFDRKWLTKSS